MPTQAVRCERAVRVIGPDDTVCQEPRRHLGIRQSCGNNPVLKLGGRPGLNPAKPQVFPHQPSVTAIRPLRRTRWERSIMADLSDQKTAQHPPARSRFDREAERDVEKIQGIAKGKSVLRRYALQQTLLPRSQNPMRAQRLSRPKLFHGCSNSPDTGTYIRNTPAHQTQSATSEKWPSCPRLVRAGPTCIEIEAA